jgi:hypothetical protein
MQPKYQMVIGSSQDMGPVESVQAAQMSGLKVQRKSWEVKIGSWSK